MESAGWCATGLHRPSGAGTASDRPQAVRITVADGRCEVRSIISTSQTPFIIFDSDGDRLGARSRHRRRAGLRITNRQGTAAHSQAGAASWLELRLFRRGLVARFALLALPDLLSDRPRDLAGKFAGVQPQSPSRGPAGPAEQCRGNVPGRTQPDSGGPRLRFGAAAPANGVPGTALPVRAPQSRLVEGSAAWNHSRTPTPPGSRASPFPGTRWMSARASGPMPPSNWTASHRSTSAERRTSPSPFPAPATE